MAELLQRVYTSVNYSYETADKLNKITRGAPLDKQQPSIGNVIDFALGLLTEKQVEAFYKALPAHIVSTNHSKKVKKLTGK